MNQKRCSRSASATIRNRITALNGTEGTLSPDGEGQSTVGSGKILTRMQRPHPALSFIYNIRCGGETTD